MFLNVSEQALFEVNWGWKTLKTVFNCYVFYRKCTRLARDINQNEMMQNQTARCLISNWLLFYMVVHFKFEHKRLSEAMRNEIMRNYKVRCKEACV